MYIDVSQEDVLCRQLEVPSLLFLSAEVDRGWKNKVFLPGKSKTQLN